MEISELDSFTAALDALGFTHMASQCNSRFGKQVFIDYEHQSGVVVTVVITHHGDNRAITTVLVGDTRNNDEVLTRHDALTVLSNIKSRLED